MSDDQSGVVTLKVRVTPDFREKIVDTAKQNNRSMNQEIIHRLEESFQKELIIDGLFHTAVAMEAIDKMPAQDLLAIVFQKMNAKGLTITVEEIKRVEEKPVTKTNG